MLSNEYWAQAYLSPPLPLAVEGNFIHLENSVMCSLYSKNVPGANFAVYARISNMWADFRLLESRGSMLPAGSIVGYSFFRPATSLDQKSKGKKEIVKRVQSVELCTDYMLVFKQISQFDHHSVSAFFWALCNCSFGVVLVVKKVMRKYVNLQKDSKSLAVLCPSALFLFIYKTQSKLKSERKRKAMKIHECSHS